MMNLKNSTNFSYPAQLGLLIGLIGTGLIVGSLISAGAWIGMTGRPIHSMETDMVNPKYYNAILAVQVIFTLFIFILPVYLFASICYRKPLQYFGFKTPFHLMQLLWVFAILVLAFPLSITLADLTQIIPLPKNWETKFKAMEAAREAQEAALIHINTFSKYLISMVVIAILPAIFEEVLFRGGIQNILTRWFKGPWAAILITAIVFSIIHVSFYGFFVRFALGVILGLIFYYTGSLWLAIILHFFYNGLQVTILYITTTDGKIHTNELEQSLPLWIGAVALVLMGYAFKRLKEISQATQQEFNYNEVDDPDDFHNWIANQKK